jgi:hypothetical protein
MPLIHNIRSDIKPIIYPLTTTTPRQENISKNKTGFHGSGGNKMIAVTRGLQTPRYDSGAGKSERTKGRI